MSARRKKFQNERKEKKRFEAYVTNALQNLLNVPSDDEDSSDCEEGCEHGQCPASHHNRPFDQFLMLKEFTMSAELGSSDIAVTDKRDIIIDCLQFKNAEQLKMEGNRLFLTNYDEAILRYQEAVWCLDNASHPDRKRVADLLAKCKGNIAQCYLKKKRYEDALEAALDSIEAMESHTRSYVRAAEAFEKLGNEEMAIYTVRKGLEWSADSSELQKKLQEKKEKRKKPFEKVDKELKTLHKNDRAAISRYLKSLNLRSLAEVKGVFCTVPELKRDTGTSSDDNAGETDSSDDEGGRPQAERRKKIQPIVQNNSDTEDSDKSATKRNPKVKAKKVEKKVEKPIVESPEMLRNRAKFQELMETGSRSLINKVPRTSVDALAKALSLVNSETGLIIQGGKLVPVVESPDVVALKYTLGMAYVETNSYDNIILARAVFDSILNEHKNIRFPAVYLGKAILYKRLNRYEPALKWAVSGLQYLDRGLAITPFNWPGLPSEVIRETIVDEVLRPELTSLEVELSQPPPRPDAVCKYPACINHSTHILPSENIYLGDPDYRGHYKVVCRENCLLEYHGTCWNKLKEELIIVWKVTKTPTKKEFFGKPCFTPDCIGVIIRIETIDQNGEVEVLDDPQEEEERRRRDEARIRRKEEEEHKSKTKTCEQVKKKKKAKPRSSPPLSEPTNNKEIKMTINGEAGDAAGHYVNEPINIDLRTEPLITLKKNKADLNPEEDPEENHHKKRKNNKKPQTLSLNEFIGDNSPKRNPECWPGNSFDERVEKATELNTAMLEGRMPPSNYAYINGFKSDARPSPTYSAPSNSASRNGTPTATNQMDFDPMTETVLRESIFTYLYDLLRNQGPLLYNSETIWRNISPESVAMIGGRANIKQFIVEDLDNRFRTYKDYLCLEANLATAIRMVENEGKENACIVTIGPEETEEGTASAQNGIGAKNMDTYDITELSESLPSNFSSGEVTKNMSKLRSMLTAGGKSDSEHNQAEIKRNNLPDWEEASRNSELEKIRQAAIIPKQTALNRAGMMSVHKISLGVQTDVSSIELEDTLDSFTLQQTNSELINELQLSKDKLCKIQNDKKLEIKQLTDDVSSKTAELKRARSEAQKSRDEVQKMRKAFNDIENERREHKNLLEKLETQEQINKELLDKMGQEQHLSFQLETDRKKKEAAIVTMKQMVINSKEEHLKAVHDQWRKFLEGKLEENSRVVSYIKRLRTDPRVANHPNLFDKALSEIENFIKNVMKAMDDLEKNFQAEKKKVMKQDYKPNLGLDQRLVEPPRYTIDLFMLLLMSASVPPVSRELPPPPPPMGGIGQRMAMGYQHHPHIPAFGRGAPLQFGVDHAMPTGPRSFPGMPPHMSPQAIPHPDQQDTRGFGPAADPPVSSSNGVLHAGGPPANRHNTMAKPGPIARPNLGPIGQPMVSTAAAAPAAAAAAVVVATPPVSVPTPPPSLPPPPQPLAAAAAAAEPEVARPILRDMLPPGGATAGVSTPPPMDGSKGKLKKSHEALVERLVCEYPQLNHSSANSYIKKLRDSNGGKLSGMSVPEITKKIGELIEESSLTSAEGQDTNECSICMTEMLPENTRILDPCNHQFHHTCIRSWLGMAIAGNSCPLCRNYVSKDDEYPELGRFRN